MSESSYIEQGFDIIELVVDVEHCLQVHPHHRNVTTLYKLEISYVLLNGVVIV